MFKLKYLFVLAGLIGVIGLVWVFAIQPNKTQDVASAPNAKDLVIEKSTIKTASFIPYTLNGTKMEVVAVKASDGTIKTAFNTCQVCYSSGRGYYKVEGNTLVCQNCGNRFSFDQVSKQKGGCNPVPILAADKTENDTQIIISKDVFSKAKDLFASWKS